MREHDRGLEATLHGTRRGEAHRGLWLVAGLAILILTGIRYFVPQVIGNEFVYLIGPRQVVEPLFLEGDWTVGGQPDLHPLFTLLIAPLWMLTKSSVTVALAGRVLIWSALTLSILKLARTLGARPLLLVLGMAIFLYFRQGIAAGEWIFGSVEQKCLAYAFLFLALSFGVEGRPLRMGIFSGLALLSHILVGGWGAIVLACALLLSSTPGSIRRLRRFAVPVAIAGLLLLPTVVTYLMAGTTQQSVVEGPFATSEILVRFRAPHHLDPEVFLGERPLTQLAFALFLLAFLPISVSVMLRRVLNRRAWSFITAFSFGLVALYGMGLVARQMNAFWFLKYYPFRLGDALLPLLFWLVAPTYLVSYLRRPFVDFKLPFGRTRTEAVVAVFAAVLVAACFAKGIAHAIPLALARYSSSGAQSQKGEKFRDVTTWIRRTTPEDSIFVIPPWRVEFWLDAERACVVNFKECPSNTRAHEWYRRLLALNRGIPFSEVGFDCLGELRENYPKLTRDELADLRRSTGCDFYLTAEERPDLAGLLRFDSEGYFVYRIPK